VTVLFADLSGFTALSERLDPEEVRAFQNALFQSLAQAVARFDGFVAKYLGDAILAVFGAPVAHEDDPERALEGALDMLARGATLSEQWAVRLSQPVTLHIAVHTGPVVAGTLTEVAGAAYDVTGDTVNTASRLLGAAAPGTILVSEATATLARHRFAFEAAGEIALRGKARAMAVHRLLGPLSQPLSARGLASYGLESPMVGRVGELGQLLDALGRAQRGRAQLVSVAGEAGTGKSRLIAEFLRRVGDDPQLAATAVRRHGCSSLGEPAYGTFAALFRDGYQVAAEDPLEVAREKLATGLRSLGAPLEVAETVMPVLSYLLGLRETSSRDPDLDPEQVKRQIALAARTLVERRLDQGPVLLVVEDLHWADSASLDLLGHIADHLAGRPLMILVSLRPEARRVPVAQAERTELRLSRLSGEETAELVGSLLGRPDEAAFARVQRLVATRADGNPLFVEEMVRSLINQGVLVRERNRWSCGQDSEAVNIPPTLQGLLLSRVDRLPPDDRRLLQEAAVLGMAFEQALLRAIATGPDGVAAGLGRLTDCDLIQPLAQGREGGGRYQFTHALVREAVYENLLFSRRSELHERVGLALERAVGPEPSRLSDLEALGHHWSLASHKSKGARYLTAAGDRASAVYANDDAMRHYERALRTLSECQACQGEAEMVRERLADLLALGGRRAEAFAHYEAVQQVLGAAGDRAGAARLVRKIGSLHWEAGDRERASACLASGLALLGEDGSPIERAHLFQEIGRLAFRTGDNASAVEWADKALAEAAREDAASAAPDSAATRAQAYNTLGVALARMDRLDEAVDRIEHSIALAEQHGLLHAACRGYTNLGVLYSSLNPRRCIETCLRGLETAKKAGDLGFQSRLYANLAVAYCALTDRCEADGIEAAQKAVELDRRLELVDHLAVPLIVLGQIHQCHGDHGRALASYREALSLAERMGDPQLLVPCYDGLATLSLDAGNAAMAEVYFGKAQEVCQRAGLDPDVLLVLPFLC
jgi:adenylate cyclase